MFPGTSFLNMGASTCSPGSLVGKGRSKLQVGRQMSLFGRVPVLANPSVVPERERGTKTKDISGRNSEDSLTSADLQLSLESRLQANLDVNGSPEYVLTWKKWDMQSGPPICALRASARRTSGKDCTGWPTPDTESGGHSSRGGERKDEPLMGGLARGLIPESFTAETGKPAAYRLNPLFSLWLMGYREEWLLCAVSAIALCRSLRRSL
jgi:hypothetical protein